MTTNNTSTITNYLKANVIHSLLETVIEIGTHLIAATLVA
jgi:hypothetical protein